MEKDLRSWQKSEGWDSDNLYDLMEVLEEIRSVKYEIDNCVRGSYTGAVTYKELKKSLWRLAEKFSDAVDCISDEYADRQDELEYEQLVAEEEEDNE
jgi:hypothetical protein